MRESDFARLLTSYLSKFLPSQRNLSANTIKSYRDTFRLFLIFCQDQEGIKTEKICLAGISDRMILSFLDWIETKRSCSIATRNQRLAALHAFFRYAQAESPENLLMYQKILHIPFKKDSEHRVSYLTPDGMKLLLSMPDTRTRNGRRDLILMTLLYDSAARVQELIDLKVRDIRFESPATIILHGKGRKVRCIPLMTKTSSMLESYLKESNLWEKPERLDSYLFFNSRQEQLTRAGISYIIDKYYTQASQNGGAILPERISPHVFRHTKAMHLLQANINLIYIRDFLGHSNVTTTEIYAKADAEIRRKLLEKAYINLSPSDLPEWNDDKDLMTWLQELCT